MLFEIAKYLDRAVGIPTVDKAYESRAILKQKRENAMEYLNKKLSERPSKEDLESKNIIKETPVDFDYIHSQLELIEFRENESTVSPRIANLVRKLDFHLKKRIITEKLGIKKLQ